MKFLLVPILVFAIFPNVSNAGELYNFYNGIREQGMGGASIAVVDDETALYLNPAGLGRLRSTYWTVANPEVETDTQGIKTTSGKFSTATNLQTLVNNLSTAPGKHYHLQEALTPSLVMPNFSIGAFALEDTDADVDSAGANVDLHYRRDVGAIFGYDLRLWGGRFKLGFNVRGFDRVAIDNTFATNTSNLTLAQDGSEGWALASDGGVLLTAPIRYLPALAIVARDLGGTSFGLGQPSVATSGQRPSYVRPSFDVGVAISPILANRIRSEFTVEMDDVTNPDHAEQAHVIRRLHAGMEINFADAFFIRGGVNQGYWTAGLELDLGHVQWQLASYGEDIGSPGQSQEDRRYVAQLAYRWF